MSEVVSSERKRRLYAKGKEKRKAASAAKENVKA
jgi:hypothetical protein